MLVRCPRKESYDQKPIPGRLQPAAEGAVRSVRVRDEGMDGEVPQSVPESLAGTLEAGTGSRGWKTLRKAGEADTDPRAVPSWKAEHRASPLTTDVLAGARFLALGAALMEACYQRVLSELSARRANDVERQLRRRANVRARKEGL